MLFVLVEQQLFPVLCSYLKPLDLMSLRCLNKRWYSLKDEINKIFEQKVFNNFRKRINDHAQVNPDKLMDIVFKYGGIFSGSFVLSCIMESDWFGNDIDVWIYDSMDSNFYKIRREYNNILPRFIDIHEVFTYYSGYNEIIGIDNYRCNKSSLIVQHIYINYDPKEYIIDRYDWTVCQNMIYMEDGQLRLVINDLDSIINKRLVFNHISDSVNKIMARITKYKERGFRFEVNEELLDYVLCGNFGDINYYRLDTLPKRFKPDKDLLNGSIVLDKLMYEIFGSNVRCYNHCNPKMIHEIYVEWGKNE